MNETTSDLSPDLPATQVRSAYFSRWGWTTLGTTVTLLSAAISVFWYASQIRDPAIAQMSHGFAVTLYAMLIRHSVFALFGLATSTRSSHSLERQVLFSCFCLLLGASAAFVVLTIVAFCLAAEKPYAIVGVIGAFAMWCIALFVRWLRIRLAFAKAEAEALRAEAGQQENDDGDHGEMFV